MIRPTCPDCGGVATINGQQTTDVWLHLQCSNCQTTWGKEAKAFDDIYDLSSDLDGIVNNGEDIHITWADKFMGFDPAQEKGELTSFTITDEPEIVAKWFVIYQDGVAPCTHCQSTDTVYCEELDQQNNWWCYKCRSYFEYDPIIAFGKVKEEFEPPLGAAFGMMVGLTVGVVLWALFLTIAFLVT